jgi:hypothetical protein
VPLHIQIGINQLVQSHTIFKRAARELGDKPILVVGGQDDVCRKVAQRSVSISLYTCTLIRHARSLLFHSYGFKHVYIPVSANTYERAQVLFVTFNVLTMRNVQQDLLAWNPAMWPFYELTEKDRSFVQASCRLCRFLLPISY